MVMDVIDDDLWSIFPLTDSFEPSLTTREFAEHDKLSPSKTNLTKPKPIRDRWRSAYKKTKLLYDPWFEFHFDEYKAENVVRHRYDAVKKKWKQDKCVVKMESKSFANGTKLKLNFSGCSLKTVLFKVQ
jgi:hypothetical protein